MKHIIWVLTALLLGGAAVASYANNSYDDGDDPASVAAYEQYSIDTPAIAQPIGYSSISNLPSRIRAPGEPVFVFSPRSRAWAAYDSSGRRVSYGKANGGADYCSDVGRACRTPSGHFRVQRKGSADCRSGKFPLPNGGAPMPYCMFFRGGYAIHGSPSISNVNGSHGCIRVSNSAAAWLHRYFIRHGTKVIVLSY